VDAGREVKKKPIPQTDIHFDMSAEALPERKGAQQCPHISSLIYLISTLK
jgi:hypothetical protein